MAFCAPPGLEGVHRYGHMAPPGLENMIRSDPGSSLCAPMASSAKIDRFSHTRCDGERGFVTNPASKSASQSKGEFNEVLDKTLPLKIPVEYLNCTDRYQPRSCLALQQAAYAPSNALAWSQSAAPAFPPGFFDTIDTSSAKRPDRRQKCEKLPGKNNTGQRGRTQCDSPGKIGNFCCTEQEDIRLSSLLKRLNSETTDVSLEDVLPCLAQVAQDESGSQFLQVRLPDATKEVQAIVFGAALPCLVSLSLHPYGHAFVLRLLEVASLQQKRVVAEQLSPHVKQLTLDSNGCRVIQKAVKLIPHESRERLIQGLKECTPQCMKSMHGNHVLQVCVEEMPSTSIAFIVEAVSVWGADNASAHMNACRVVMRLLEHAQEQVRGLVQEILQSIPRLAQDRYGNYVLQHILEHGEMSYKRYLISEVIRCGVSTLACRKYAHNVIEKCIDLALSPEYETSLALERVSLISELLSSDGGSIVVTLAGERFGVKVVEYLMDHLHGAELEQLLRLLRNGEAYLQDKESAVSVLAKMQA